MKNIIDIGVSEKNSFEVNKHIKIVNTFVVFGGVVSLTFGIVALPFHFYIYSLVCFLCFLIMLLTLMFNRFGKYELAKSSLLVSVPIILIGFYLLFGPIGLKYYLFSEIVFLFFLFKKTWLRVSMFLFLFASFFTIEVLTLNTYYNPSHAIFEWILYVNIIISFILTFIGLNLFYQEHIRNQKTIEVHNESLRAKNREIQNQNIIKDKLFSLISHDLKGPLRSLNVLIDMLGNEYITAEQLREQLPGFSEKLNNTTNLIENLLTWTKTQFKGIKANPQKVELVEVVNEIIELFEENLKKKFISVDVKFSGTDSVVTDKEMIGTILRNIIHNAIKYSTQNSRIQVSLDHRNENYLITIKDEGIGMNQELVEKFNKNEELVSVEGTSGEKGTGLGLLIVKEISEEIKAKVTIQSTKGKGTTFTVVLPQKI